jgi:hypothetical protein
MIGTKYHPAENNNVLFYLWITESGHIPIHSWKDSHQRARNKHRVIDEYAGLLSEPVGVVK